MFKFAWACTAETKVVNTPCKGTLNVGSHCVQCPFSTDSDKITIVDYPQEVNNDANTGTERGISISDGGK